MQPLSELWTKIATSPLRKSLKCHWSKRKKRIFPREGAGLGRVRKEFVSRKWTEICGTFQTEKGLPEGSKRYFPGKLSPEDLEFLSSNRDSACFAATDDASSGGSSAGSASSGCSSPGGSSSGGASFGSAGSASGGHF